MQGADFPHFAVYTPFSGSFPHGPFPHFTFHNSTFYQDPIWTITNPNPNRMAYLGGFGQFPDGSGWLRMVFLV